MESSDRVTLFEDIFEVIDLNPETGKRFDRVNRISATATTYECDLLLDINSEIYSIKQSDRISLMLASTLSLDGSPDDHYSYSYSFASGAKPEPTLADNYEYVMHGRVFDIAYKGDENIEISASFGGLLMRLTGEQKQLSNIQPDMKLYILIKQG
eukprot:CAMPEP_0178956766 /NCGR_PEP_ID=MMETSP0789-20121207/10473_1 /TAXON_ID=3005 /ORGANISM="Rhizosolenia setigera, Strain CCMP 1694" /LENGTH=154 /DNA_ID=CAMNT_0020638805 /DNA_START=227 /DNA_END=691 /DNA_ORIENTATION=-